jgi:hypothetical protein
VLQGRRQLAVIDGDEFFMGEQLFHVDFNNA